MMYSAETKVLALAWKQYLYKFKSFSFFGLIILQIITLLFSSSGVGMYGSGNGNIFISVKNYTSDIVIAFTMIWAFVISLSYANKQAKNLDFTLVSNRLSSGLSNLGLFMTISILGALTSTLSGMLFRVIMYFFADRSVIIGYAFKLSFSDWFQGFLAIALYLILICTAGYLFGMFMEVNRIFAVIIPAVLFGVARWQSDFFISLLQFFIAESSLLLFAGKVIFAAAVLFGLSMLIFNRMEVRR